MNKRFGSRLVSFGLAMLMLFGSVPSSAYAAEVNTADSEVVAESDTNTEVSEELEVTQETETEDTVENQEVKDEGQLSLVWAKDSTSISAEFGTEKMFDSSDALIVNNEFDDNQKESMQSLLVDCYGKTQESGLEDYSAYRGMFKAYDFYNLAIDTEVTEYDTLNYTYSVTDSEYYDSLKDNSVGVLVFKYNDNLSEVELLPVEEVQLHLYDDETRLEVCFTGETGTYAIAYYDTQWVKSSESEDAPASEDTTTVDAEGMESAEVSKGEESTEVTESVDENTEATESEDVNEEVTEDVSNVTDESNSEDSNVTDENTTSSEEDTEVANDSEKKNAEDMTTEEKRDALENSSSSYGISEVPNNESEQSVSESALGLVGVGEKNVTETEKGVSSIALGMLDSISLLSGSASADYKDTTLDLIVGEKVYITRDGAESYSDYTYARFVPKYTHDYTFITMSDRKSEIKLLNSKGYTVSGYKSQYNDSFNYELTAKLEANKIYYVGVCYDSWNSSMDDTQPIPVRVEYGNFNTRKQNHEITETITKEATCTESGIITYTCSCGEYEGEIEIPALNHDYVSKVTKEATCVDDGEITYTCSRCGDEYTEVIEATGVHKHADGDTGKIVSEADCTHDGEVEYTCEMCHEKYTEVIKHSGHNLVDGVCSVCGEKLNVAIKLSYDNSDPNRNRDFSGFVIEVYPATRKSVSSSGRVSYTYSSDSVLTITDNTGNMYYGYLTEDMISNATDGQFRISIVSTPDDFSASSSYRYLELQSSGMYTLESNLYVYGTHNRYTYAKIYVRDSVTGELVDGFKIGAKRKVYDEITSEPTWINCWGSGDNDFNYGDSQISDLGNGVFITAPNGYYVPVTYMSGAVGTSFRFGIISAPVGYLDDASVDLVLTSDMPENSSLSKTTILNLYVTRKGSTNIALSDGSNYIPDVAYKVYEDSFCTKEAFDLDGNTIEGTTSDSVIKLPEIKANKDGYWIKFSNIPSGYTESGTDFVQYLNIDNDENIYRLTSYSTGVDVAVKVIDSFKSQDNISGFGLKVQEYSISKGDYVDTDIVVSETENGYVLAEKLNQTSDNRGMFRIADTRTPEGYVSGSYVDFNISGKNSYTVSLEKATVMPLYDILKKDESGAYCGDVIITKYGDVMASTNQDDDIEVGYIKYSDWLDVNLKDLQVETDGDNKVKTGVIYSMELADDIKPYETTDWEKLVKTGKAEGYGRIASTTDDMGVTHWFFQIYFENIKNQYDIKFGYSYQGKLNERYSAGGDVNTSYLNQEISFDVYVPEPDEKKKVNITKYAGWTTEDGFGNDTDRLSGSYSNKSVQPENSEYTRGVVTINIDNNSEENLNLVLKESIPYEWALLYTSGKKDFPFRVYLSDDGENWKQENWLGYPQNFSIYTSQYKFSISDDYNASNTNITKNGNISVKLTTPYDSSYKCMAPKYTEVNTRGNAYSEVMLYIQNVNTKHLRIVYYIDPVTSNFTLGENNTSGYEAPKITSGSYGSINGRYNSSIYGSTVTTEVVDVLMRGISDKDCTDTVSANLIKGLSKFSISMSGDFSDADKESSELGAVRFWTNFTNKGSSNWFEFTERPWGSDWGVMLSDAKYASTGYYYHAPEFTTHVMPRNWSDLDVRINGKSMRNGSFYGLSYMTTYDPKSARELYTLMAEEGYTNYLTGDVSNSYPVICYKDTSRGSDRYYWLFMSPELTIETTGWNPWSELREDGGTSVDGLPAGIKFYVLGLNHGDTVSISCTKYQRQFSADYRSKSYDNYEWEIDDIGYVGSQVYLRNENHTGYSANYFKDTHRNKYMLTSSSELLSDGSIKYRVAVDIRKLASYLSSNSEYIGSPGYDMLATSYIFVNLPDGYSLGQRKFYDSDFNQVTSKDSFTYISGMLYLTDKVDDFVVGASSYDDTIWSSRVFPLYFNQMRGKNAYGFSIPTNALISFVEEASRTKDFLDFTFIAYPDRGISSMSGKTVSTQIEFVLASSDDGKQDIEYSQNRLIDDVCSTGIYIPRLSSKGMDISNNGDSNIWTAIVGIDIRDTYSSLESNYINGVYKQDEGYQVTSVRDGVLRGSVSLHDDMSDSYVTDSEGNKIEGVDVAKYISLKGLNYYLDDKKCGEFSPETDSVVLSGDKDSLFSYGDGIIYPDKLQLYGYNRYQTSDEFTATSLDDYRLFGIYGKSSWDRVASLDYAPTKTSVTSEEATTGVQYSPVGYCGGDYYAMNGGFNFTLGGIANYSKLTLTYDLEFDYEAFAKDYPDLGSVTVHCVNNVYNNYSNLSDYKNENLTSTMSDFSFSTCADMDKNVSDLSEDTYSRSYTLVADTGVVTKNSVYISDQIDSVTDISSKLVVDSAQEENLKKWIDCLKVDNLKITVRNYIDKDTYDESVIYEDGKVTDDTWSIKPVDKDVLKNIKVAEGFTTLNGNLFAFEISKSDGSIPANTSFRVYYDLSINHDKVNSKTPFRNLVAEDGTKLYTGGQVNIQNHAAIAYLVSEDIADSSQSGTVEAGWTAAGSVVDAPFLRGHESTKVGSTLHATDESDKGTSRGMEKFSWSLINKDWTAGNDETSTHNWGDTMVMSALLDSNSQEEQYKGFGDDSLNEAWVNLFFKHLTFTDWSVRVKDTVSDDDITTFTNPTRDGNTLKFTDKDSNLTVKVNMDALEYRNGNWMFKKQADTFTDESKSIYDVYGIGCYIQGYYTKAEFEDFRTKYPGADAQPYGYGTNHLFDAEVSGQDYLTTVYVDYEAYIDWDELYADAKSMGVSDSFASWYTANKDSLDSEFVSTIDNILELQKAYDETSEKLGLSGKDALKVGVADNPRYSELLNYGATGSESHMSKSDWEYSPEAEGSLTKTAEVVGDDVIWTANLKVGNNDYIDYSINDSLTVPEGLSEDVYNNSVLAKKYMSLNSFVITNGDDEVLYTYNGDFTGSVDAGSVEGVYDNCHISFDDTTKLYVVTFDRVYANANLKFKYTTGLDMQEFINNGGVFDTEIHVNNSVRGSNMENDLSASASGIIYPSSGSNLEKEAVDGGYAYEQAWVVRGTVGNVDVNSFNIHDAIVGENSTVTDKVLPFYNIKNMKVTLLGKEDSDGNRKSTVVYDSDKGVDDLKKYGFSFGDDFSIGENGKYNWDLNFVGSDSHKTLVSGTTVVVEYMTALDKDAFKEAGNENGNYKIKNTATMTHSGGVEMDATTTPDTDIPVYDELTKTGDHYGAQSSGKDRLTWDIDLHLTQWFTEEELANADPDEVVITDILQNTDILQYEEGSVRLYELNERGVATTPISDSEYSVRVSGKRSIITLQHPSQYPDVRVSLRTTAIKDGELVNNYVEVSLSNKEINTTSPDIETEIDGGGYISSNEKVGNLVINKTDSVTNEPIKDVKFLLYSVADNGDESLAGNIVYKNGSYVCDYQESEEFWHNTDSKPLVTNSDGKIVVNNLPFGYYIARETKSADGYIAVDESGKPLEYKFAITDETCTFDEETQSYVVNFTWDAKNIPISVKLHKYYNEQICGVEYKGDLANVPIQVWTVDKDGDKSEKVAEALTGVGGNVVFNYLVPGDYVFVEAEAPDGFAVADEIPFTVKDNGTIESKFMDDNGIINMKDDVITHSIEVDKTVVGSLGSKIKDFKFKITFISDGIVVKPSKLPFTKGLTTGVAELDSTGSYEFTLSHGESIVFNNIPEGITYKIEEIDAEDLGYEVTSTNSSGVLDEDVVSTFTNTKKGTVPTSADTNAKVFFPVVMLTLAGIVYNVKNRKKRKIEK